MTPGFNEKKATQLAGLLLKMRGQGYMSYMKLIKLMYLIDRQSLLRWGWSMTGDTYNSLKNGQILSTTYDLVRDRIWGKGNYWKQFISGPDSEKDVRLIASTETDELSLADIRLAEEIFAEFGKLGRFEIADYTHALPEYRKTDGPSLPVGYADVLEKAGNLSSEEIEKILEELHGLAQLESLTL
jgi:hypothetical protein